MNDRSRILWSTLLGAAIGGLVGYLYLTESGRQTRSLIEPRLDDLLQEIARVRNTLSKAQAAAREGWRSLNEFAGTREGSAPPEWSGSGRRVF